MEQQIRSIEEIKILFPDEWVLIGDPEMNANGLHVLSGIPILHSKDKREVSYLGRDKTEGFKTVTVIYTGSFKSSGRVMTGIFNSAKI